MAACTPTHPTPQSAREPTKHTLKRGAPAAHRQQRALDRPPARAVGPQEGAVDVEEDELHGRKDRRLTATRYSRSRFAAAVSASKSSETTPPRDKAECTMRPAPAHSATCEMRRPSAKQSTSPAS